MVSLRAKKDRKIVSTGNSCMFCSTAFSIILTHTAVMYGEYNASVRMNVRCYCMCVHMCGFVLAFVTEGRGKLKNSKTYLYKDHQFFL